jgi:hypothetical protein
MNKQDLFNEFIPKDRDLQQVAGMVIKSPEVLKCLVSGLNETDARIKYSCNNTLLILSKNKPEIIYPYFDVFNNYLKSENKFIKWSAILIIANLTMYDNKKKFDKIFNSYFSEIKGPVMITAANIIKGAAVIAKAKPYLTEKITKELFKVKNAKYQTGECLNIVIGYTISSFDKFFKQIKDQDEVLDFVRSSINNRRKPTRNKAEKFIKKWDKLSISH